MAGLPRYRRSTGTATSKQRRAFARRLRGSGCRTAVTAIVKAFLVEAKQHREEKDIAEEDRAGEQEDTRGQKAETQKSLSLGVLPQDLVIQVLMRLPLYSIVQMRVLSKSFNAFLRAPPFPQPPLLITMKQIPGPDMLIKHRELIAYCPQLNTWFPLPVQGQNLLSVVGGPGFLQVVSPFFLPLAMASAGGLMCTVVNAPPPDAERQVIPKVCYPGFLSHVQVYQENFHILVFNCFTGASKRLPPPPPEFSAPTNTYVSANLHVYMFQDASAPGAYYVVLNRPRFDLWTSYVPLSIYSSRKGCWMDGNDTSTGPYPGTFGDIQKCDLFSYCDGPSEPEDDLRYDTLFAYAIHLGSWLRIHIIPSVEEQGVWRYVFKWQGRVFLASSHKGDAGFKVCALRSSSRWSNSASWVEVATTPASLQQSSLAESRSHSMYETNFLLCGNLVCMTGGYGSQIVGNYLQPLVYDLARDSWYYLPSPSFKGSTTEAGVGLLAFQPHLQVTP